jgi:hypothetical protein
LQIDDIFGNLLEVSPAESFDKSSDPTVTSGRVSLFWKHRLCGLLGDLAAVEAIDDFADFVIVLARNAGGDDLVQAGFPPSTGLGAETGWTMKAVVDEVVDAGAAGIAEPTLHFPHPKEHMAHGFPFRV